MRVLSGHRSVDRSWIYVRPLLCDGLVVARSERVDVLPRTIFLIVCGARVASSSAPTSLSSSSSLLYYHLHCLTMMLPSTIYCTCLPICLSSLVCP